MHYDLIQIDCNSSWTDIYNVGKEGKVSPLNIVVEDANILLDSSTQMLHITGLRRQYEFVFWYDEEVNKELLEKADPSELETRDSSFWPSIFGKSEGVFVKKKDGWVLLKERKPFSLIVRGNVRIHDSTGEPE